jgi:hypothetical protein
MPSHCTRKRLDHPFTFTTFIILFTLSCEKFCTRNDSYTSSFFTLTTSIQTTVSNLRPSQTELKTVLHQVLFDPHRSSFKIEKRGIDWIRSKRKTTLSLSVERKKITNHNAIPSFHCRHGFLALSPVQRNGKR